MKPNFYGCATKYGVLCTDGRTIMADAFKHQHGKKIPLVYRHGDKENPMANLGFVVLEHRAGDGIYVKGYFNNTEVGTHTRGMVEHGDYQSLSIKAAGFHQNGTQVVDGQLLEVSLVPYGANSEARIEEVYLSHADGFLDVVDGSGVIYSGEPIVIEHEDTIESPEDDDTADEPHLEHAQTVREFYDSLDEDGKLAVDLLVAAAAGIDIEQEQDPNMANVFDQTETPKGDSAVVLTHEQQASIINNARSKRITLRESLIEHAGEYGITNIEDLFPEPKNINGRPEWITRDMGWVSGVLNGVHAIPFTRVKSRTADLTHEEARARGYIKGDLKVRQFFEIKSRTTTPKTIYKAQALDKDDEIDTTDFDVISWIQEEMGFMLREEIARAILFGDGRPVEDPANPGEPNPAKINEENIRPIATDDDFYTAKVTIGTGVAAKTLHEKILRSKKLIRGGTGKPTLYTTNDMVVDLLLMKDKLGRRYYNSVSELATSLDVKEIVEVEVLEQGYFNEDGDRLLGVIVNLGDYDFGTDPKGKTTWYSDFDIDYNLNKYLIETRRSGALVRHRSAVSLWESAGIEVTPTEPGKSGNVITVPTITGVVYTMSIDGADPVAATGTVTLTAVNTPIEFFADPATGYRFPLGVISSWEFEHTP